MLILLLFFSFNLLNTFMVLKLFPTLEMNVEYYGVFWIYAANCLVGSAFVYFVLPETKGKTLAEIEKHFAS
jgi:facilitated trehalose transporter